MILTSLQRDFLDRYNLECVFCRTDSTYARDLARQNGFTYEHMDRLWDIYCRSWSGDSDRWGDVVPPVSPPPDPPVFPWSSIEELEQQLEAVEAERRGQPAVAEKLSALTTVDDLDERAARGDRARYDRVLAKIPDVPAAEDDRLSEGEDEGLDMKQVGSLVETAMRDEDAGDPLLDTYQR